MVCRGKRIVVPPSLQTRIVKLSHAAHPGMSKAKALIRTFCWFPGIDQAVERQVRECLSCQAVQPPRNAQPIKPLVLPKAPWQYVEMDFQGPYPNGDYIMIIIDRYSRWPEMAFFRKAPNAKQTISAMETIFANKGTPEVCQSDNGPPFQSSEMADFAKWAGFYHKHITPEWPRANGTVERFNRSMKEAIQAGCVDEKPLRRAAIEFIGMYRATPHSATDISPYAAMYGGRQMRSSFPVVLEDDGQVDRVKDEQYKKKMCDGDKGVSHRFQVGDTVIVKQRKVDKLTPAFNPERLTVIDVIGSTVMAVNRSRSRRVTQDASYFRAIRVLDEDDEEDDSDPTDEPVPSG